MPPKPIESDFMMFANTVHGWIQPADREATLRLGHAAAPTLHSREQMEQFIAELHEAAEDVWPNAR